MYPTEMNHGPNETIKNRQSTSNEIENENQTDWFLKDYGLIHAKSPLLWGEAEHESWSSWST